MSERNTKSNILYLHRHALILMVREYTKFECENCNRTFYDRKSAEEHESLCLLQSEPTLKIREIADKLHAGESQVKHATVRLKKRGLLSRTGAKQSSYWKVNI